MSGSRMRARQRALGWPTASSMLFEDGIRPTFEDAAEEEIYDFCSELYASKRISENVYQKVADRHGAQGITDLAGLLGHYNLIAITLNIFDVEVPGGITPLAL